MRRVAATPAALMVAASLHGAPALAKTDLLLTVRGEPRGGFDPLRGCGTNCNPPQSTLLPRDANLALIGDPARSWTLSRDRLTWTLELREDARFCDGKSLAAQGVAFTFTEAKRAASTVDLTAMAGAQDTGIIRGSHQAPVRR